MKPPDSVIVAVLLVSAALQVSAQQPVRTPPTMVAGGRARAVRMVLPGTKPGILSIIQGNALTSTNASLPDSVVRLRDARFGRIVDTQMTDKSGLFAFKTVDPGSYIVEIVSADRSVLAASQLLTVDAGQAVSAVVKLPFGIPMGVIGAGSTPTATVITTQAALSSVVAVVPTIPISPNE